MRRLRAASVGIPPLLADIIRQALSGRVDVDALVEIAESPQAIACLKSLDPDVVVVASGASGDTSLATEIAAQLRRAKVVILSEDARTIISGGRRREFTADALAELLR